MKHLLRLVLIVIGLSYSTNEWALDYESFIVNDIGYKILTSNTVAVTNNAQFPREFDITTPIGHAPRRVIRKTPYNVVYDSRNIYYSGDVVIPSQVTYDNITYTVTEIEPSAFYVNNTSETINSITIPASVIRIGMRAFFSATIGTLNLANGIDTLVFTKSVSHSLSIDSIYIGRPIKYIGSEQDRSEFRQVKCAAFGPNLGSVPDSLFNNTSSLNTVWLGQDMTHIGTRAFWLSTKLKNVYFNDKLESIGDYAFYMCDSLKTVAMPTSLRTIGRNSFENSGLLNVYLSNGLEEIGAYAFDNCKTINKMVVPPSVIRIGNYALGAANIKTLELSEGADTLLFTTPDNSHLSPTIDSVFIGRPIKYSRWSRNEFNAVKHAAFGSNLASVPDSLFWGNNSYLTTVWLGQNMTHIGTWAFSNCNKLKDITFNDKLESIGDYAFYRCDSLKTVTLPTSLRTIGRNSFENSGLLNVYLSNGLEEIGAYAFVNCKKINKMVVPPSVIRIGNYALGAANIKTLELSEGADTLLFTTPDNSYSSPTIDSVFIGRPIKYSRWSRNEFNAVKHAAFGSNLASVPDSLFWGNNSYLTTVWLGQNMTHIGTRAFWNSIKLKNVYFNDKLNSIGDYAFNRCDSLKVVDLPSSMTSIGENAFASVSLDTIRANMTDVFTIAQNTFSSSTYSNAILHIPGGTIKKYKATSAWNVFLNIVPTALGVTMTATAGGSVRLGEEVVSDDTKLLQIKPNSLLTFEINVDNEYFLGCVTVNGEDVTAQITDGQLTPDILSDDMEIVATFTPKPYYDVTATASAGGSAILESTSVMWGLNTTVTFTANEGHELASVTVNGIDKTNEIVNGILTLNNIQENKSISVTFQKLRYEVTASACENGSIQLSNTLPEWGDDVVVTINPAAHYNIDKVLVNGVEQTSSLVGNTLTLQNVRSAMSVEATFCIQTFALTASANSGGSIILSVANSSVTGTSVTVAWGSSVTVSMTEDEDYELVNLFVDDVDLTEHIFNGTYTISNVEDDMTIEAVFKKIVEITLADGINYSNSRDKEYETLHYSRTFKNKNWQAWYVPFDVTLTSDVMEHFSFAKFAGTYTEDDGSFYITVVRLKEGDIVKANTPYCVQAKVADSKNPQIITQTYTTLKAAAENSFYVLSAEKKITFWGNYTRRAVTAEDKNVYAMSGGQYSKQRSGNTLASFRCFFTIEDREDNPYAESNPNPANIKLMVITDDEMGIEKIDQDVNNMKENEAGAMYDLSGRKIEPKHINKGIYIINGKKVYVK